MSEYLIDMSVEEKGTRGEVTLLRTEHSKCGLHDPGEIKYAGQRHSLSPTSRNVCAPGQCHSLSPTSRNASPNYFDFGSKRSKFSARPCFSSLNQR